MIDLSHSKPFASGGNRFCYYHPLEPSLCIKIMRPGRTAELLGRAPWYKRWRGKDDFNDNLREQEGYSQRAVLKNREGLWQHLPRWYGIEQTSLGPGAITDIILDSKGNPAPTLRQYLNRHGFDKEVHSALEEFAEWLLEYGVLTKNLIAHNLVLRREEGRLQIYVIDGLGCASFLPLPQTFEFFAKRYIQRRIRRMWLRVEWEISDRKTPWRKFESQGLRH